MKKFLITSLIWALVLTGIYATNNLVVAQEGENVAAPVDTGDVSDDDAVRERQGARGITKGLFYGFCTCKANTGNTNCAEPGCQCGQLKLCKWNSSKKTCTCESQVTTTTTPSAPATIHRGK